jgi:hypothetical protein
MSSCCDQGREGPDRHKKHVDAIGAWTASSCPATRLVHRAHPRPDAFQQAGAPDGARSLHPSTLSAGDLEPEAVGAAAEPKNVRNRRRLCASLRDPRHRADDLTTQDVTASRPVHPRSAIARPVAFNAFAPPSDRTGARGAWQSASPWVLQRMRRPRQLSPVATDVAARVRNRLCSSRQDVGTPSLVRAQE